VLRNRAAREKAYEREKIVRPITEQDLQDFMQCSGLTRHEVRREVVGYGCMTAIMTVFLLKLQNL